MNYCTRTGRLCQGGAYDGNDGLGIDCSAISREGCKYLNCTPIDLVVTRHPGLLQVLVEEGLAPDGIPVVAHASEDDLRGKHVVGVLPLELAAVAASVTVVTLAIPLELRGKELDAAQVRQYMTGVKRFEVRECD